jgi:hypothetical protein
LKLPPWACSDWMPCARCEGFVVEVRRNRDRARHLRPAGTREGRGPEVVDVAGQEVAHLEDDPLDAGAGGRRDDLDLEGDSVRIGRIRIEGAQARGSEARHAETVDLEGIVPGQHAPGEPQGQAPEPLHAEGDIGPVGIEGPRGQGLEVEDEIHAPRRLRGRGLLRARREGDAQQADK